MSKVDDDAVAGVVLALQELVTLKALKDDQGKTEKYLSMQPIAWQKAKDALHDYYESLPE